ncbi:hypothetical protein Barb7_01388 [Bacteroidales bacterium Barb7]|nr:hypothetical protein Barb7_01388 [Bacteroidales bacterium Barb7]
MRNSSRSKSDMFSFTSSSVVMSRTFLIIWSAKKVLSEPIFSISRSWVSVILSSRYALSAASLTSIPSPIANILSSRYALSAASFSTIRAMSAATCSLSALLSDNMPIASIASLMD